MGTGIFGTGLSGLLANQRGLATTGHNIANVNTHGFKTQRILFADSLYEAISPASGRKHPQSKKEVCRMCSLPTGNGVDRHTLPHVVLMFVAVENQILVKRRNRRR